MIGSGSAKGSSTMGLINPGAGIIISSSTTLLTSLAILITNEYISKLKIRYTKLRDWINVNSLLKEKFLKQSMVHLEIDEVVSIDEKQAEELKKIYNQNLGKRKEIMKNTQIKVEDVFGDDISKYKFSQEQKTKLDNFSAKLL